MTTLNICVRAEIVKIDIGKIMSKEKLAFYFFL
jgi:hypothetical protein